MTKELEEAKEWLKKNIAYYEEQLRFINATECDFYDEEIELYKNRIKIFNNILNYIENSIPKRKVKKGIDRIEYYFDRLNGPDEDIDFIKEVKQELLEDK